MFIKTNQRGSVISHFLYKASSHNKAHLLALFLIGSNGVRHHIALLDNSNDLLSSDEMIEIKFDRIEMLRSCWCLVVNITSNRKLDARPPEISLPSASSLPLHIKWYAGDVFNALNAKRLNSITEWIDHFVNILPVDSSVDAFIVRVLYTYYSGSVRHVDVPVLFCAVRFVLFAVWYSLFWRQGTRVMVA